MGLAKRVIPCLDVDAGRVVKGIQFIEIRDAGDPVEVARRYNLEGADEITFLDITASSDQRETMVHVVEKVAGEVFIPLTVGGGVRAIDDVQRLLSAGADKVAINTAAVHRPALVEEASNHYGSQCIVVAVDAKQVEGGAEPRWEIFTHGGGETTGPAANDWGRGKGETGGGGSLLASQGRGGAPGGGTGGHRRGGSRQRGGGGSGGGWGPVSYTQLTPPARGGGGISVGGGSLKKKSRREGSGTCRE